MNNKMKSRWLNAAVAVATTFTIASAHAGAVAGATEPTQILNNVQLVLQEAHQVQMVANQLRSLATLGNIDWGSASQDLSALANLVDSGNSLAYTSANIADKFNQQYPGYVPNMDYKSAYMQWSKDTLGSVRQALQTAGMQANQFATERSALGAIQALSNNPEGQVQAIQAGNSIASMMVDQMQKMRQLTFAQMQAQNAYIASQTQSQNTGVGAQRDHFSEYVPTGGAWSSAGGNK